MRRLLLTFCFSAIAGVPALAAQPPLFGGPPLAFEPAPKPLVVGAYVPSWESTAVVDAIKAGSVTHLLYAFARVCGPGQRAADEQLCAGRPPFTIASGEKEAEFDAAFQRFKAREPGVKIVASVGGWSGSDPFFHLAPDAEKRAVFVASSVEFLRTHPGFDGIDIDWEHPGDNGAANGVKLGSPADGQAYADLMSELRVALDALGKETGRKYLVTTAVNSSSAIVKRINFRQAARALDLVFMMSYDYYGGWSDQAGQHTGLQPSSPEAEDGLTAGVHAMVMAGVPAAKLVAGVAMYGRGFSGVKPLSSGGFTPTPKTGAFPPGGIQGEAGTATYKDIAARWIGPKGQGLAGFTPRFDKVTQSWSLWNAKTGDYMGYDDPRAVLLKGQYVRNAGLAGVFAWELSQDNGDILNAMNLGVGNTPLSSR
ncbi:MAG: glycoside hydrolase family 18 protein [Paucibacter sp.]|nr:glycoside hydrolase family 18 protein [Roseateles sp.]